MKYLLLVFVTLIVSTPAFASNSPGAVCEALEAFFWDDAARDCRKVVKRLGNQAFQPRAVSICQSMATFGWEDVVVKCMKTIAHKNFGPSQLRSCQQEADLGNTDIVIECLTRGNIVKTTQAKEIQDSSAL